MSLISISGKIGAGKDTVAQMMQYIDDVDNNSMPFEAWVASNAYTVYNDLNKGYTIQKWAAKLKQIAAIILGCDVEDFESQEFKDKELGEEWWEMNICPDINEPPLWAPYDAEEYTWYNDGEDRIRKMTPRLMLQLIGTECGRDVLHPNIWVNSLMSEYKGIGKNTLGPTIYPNWIITDTRFPNEIKAVEEKKGLKILVVAPTITLGANGSRTYGTTEDFDRTVKEVGITEEDMVSVDFHPSETALDNYEDWDYIIQNDGSLSRLLDKVRIIFHKEKLYSWAR